MASILITLTFAFLGVLGWAGANLWFVIVPLVVALWVVLLIAEIRDIRFVSVANRVAAAIETRLSRAAQNLRASSRPSRPLPGGRGSI